MDFVRQYNLYSEDKRKLISKALTSAAASGGALVPQKLEQLITNVMVRLSPEIAMITALFDNQKTHEFNRLVSLPRAGGAQGEGGVTPTRSSVFQRDFANLKVIRRKGAVSNFLQDASAKMYDAASVEMESHLQAHAYDLVGYINWGNEAVKSGDANPASYQHSGLDHFVSTNRLNYAGVVPTSLALLDDLLDRNLSLQGASHKKAFVMSPKMLSLFSRLLTNVRLNQGIAQGGFSMVEVDGGWRLNAYRDVPIIMSSAVRNEAVMPTPTLATSTSGGALPDSTEYFIRVSFFDWNGESQASDEVSITTGVSGTSSNKITITVNPALLVNFPIKYAVYMGTATGVYKKVMESATELFDAAGTGIADLTSITITSALPDASVPVGAQDDKPFIPGSGVAWETMFLWDLDEIQGLGKYAYTNTGGDRFNGLVTVKRLAEVDDNIPFLVKTYGALVPSFEKTSCMVRGIKVA